MQMRLHHIILILAFFIIILSAEEQIKDLEEINIAWQADGKVSASIENRPLEKVLQSLSALEKWQILVEPGLKLNVTTRFKNLSQTEALRRLLSDVNFVIIPSKNKNSRMLVYQTSSDKAIKRVIPKKLTTKTKEIIDERIKNELLVTLDPKSGINIETLASQLGAKIKGKIDGLDIYQLEFEN